MEPPEGISTPGGPAYSLDQGISKTCTFHAIANAIADQLDQDGVDINQVNVVDILLSHNKNVAAVAPKEFHNYGKPIITMDQATKKYISIKINTVEEVDSFSSTGKHVLAYYSRKKRKADGEIKWADYHCVFVQKQLKLRNNAYQCINSWGPKNDPNPVIEQNRPGNKLWVVQVEWEEAREETIDEELLTKKKTFFIKLDFIGEEYLTEYKDQSSHQFQRMCTEIKREVDEIYSKYPVHGYEGVDVLNIFKGLTIADTKKVGEKTLFVELIVKMKTNKSYAICPLRKQIQSGKLGKYTVEKFLDICEVSLDGGEGNIVTRIYQMHSQNKSVDNITDKLLQKKIISDDDYKSIKEENNSLLKANLFDQFLSKCSNKQWETYLQELQSSPEDATVCQTLHGKNLTLQPDAYPMIGIPRGIFLLIVNEDFLESTALGTYRAQGKNVDGKEIALLFQELGFIVHYYQNLTVNQMRRVFAEKATINHTGFSAFAACVITHGGDTNNIFYGTDNTMEMKDFITIFNEVPSLKSKPKFLILQFYRGAEQIDFVENEGEDGELVMPQSASVFWGDEDDESSMENVDANDDVPNAWFKEDRQKYLEAMGKDTLDEEPLDEEVSIPKNGDFLVACSTVAGYYFLENDEYSSWFINAIIEEFRAYAHKLDVATILTRVNYNVSKCCAKYRTWRSQRSSEKSMYINQLCHDFYLNPIEPLKDYKRGKVLEG